MVKKKRKKQVIFIYLGLFLATFIAFEGIRHNGFVYDDVAYITDNEHVNGGINFESIVWAFTRSYSGNWHCLTWLSHMLDCELFGLNPRGHHLVNLFIHILNTLLLFAVLKKMTFAIWPSAFVAAVFALHPLHVESVAWIAERKDVLSGFFWILTIAAYVRYAKLPDKGKYVLVVLAFCLGLLSKSMLVTLPFVLLLLDFWPLSRFKLNLQSLENSSPAQPVFNQRTILQLVIEKIPLFILSVVACIITFIVQKNAGAVEWLERLPFKWRVGNAVVSYFSYIIKMVIPRHLAVFYPHLHENLPIWQLFFSAFVLIIVSIGVICLVRKCPFLLIGWLWYLGVMVPVIGLVQVGGQSMADRYTYLSSIGIFIMVGWGFAELFSRWRYRNFFFSIASGLIFAGMLVCTRLQVGYWQNNLTLYGHAIDVTENNYVMHYNYGNTLRQAGQLEESIKHFQISLQIKPEYSKSRYNLGLVYYVKGRIKEAIECWEKGLEINSEQVPVLNNLSWVLATQKDSKFRNPERAVELSLLACKLTDYKRPDILDTLSVSYASMGKFSEAISTAEKALQLAKSEKQYNLVNEIQSHLSLYKVNWPYLE